ncbi:MULTISPECIES: phosphotransferase [Streptomyces]|uniref:Phosphotransferase n=1 Tax=Streptomyces eurythermus TaxID=42237 RepID=A0ABW6Z483_9ACTN|nr:MULTISPECIES: phosphotransferase [Streptomyces]QIS75147.1 phosphotransferase [Streptomyces sp. DSM 40868]
MSKPTKSPVVSPAVVVPRTSSEMHDVPLADDIRDRLLEQARYGAALLGAVFDGAERVWGWEGSALSLPVLDASSGAERWMKLRSRPAADPVPPYWAGAATAERVVSGLRVRRPVLLAQKAWACGGWAYQAELMSRIPVRSFSSTRAAPAWVAGLPAAWWSDLRAALDSIQDVPSTGLAPITWQETAARSLGAADPASWVASHGDVCWANLAVFGREAVLFDWDDFGRAPRFADAASLLLSSLDTPDVAARVTEYFSDQLSSPDGLYAQSVIAAHWHTRFRAGEHIDLEPALRAHMRTVEERLSLTRHQKGATA